MTQIDGPTRLLPDRCSGPVLHPRIAGAMDVSQVGLLASLVGPLADARIRVFAVSTFNTDNQQVRQADLEEATAVLQQAGHTIE